MNAHDACSMVAELTIEVSALRRAYNDLSERLADAIEERDAYRLLAKAGIHYSHESQSEFARLQDRYERSIGEARDLRRLLLGERAAA